SCSTTSALPLIQIDLGRARADASRAEPVRLPFSGTAEYPNGLFIGLDVGSTTVKFVVVDPVTDAILLSDYQRHETKQPEKCLEMLRAIEARFANIPHEAFRIFATGSGGAG